MKSYSFEYYNRPPSVRVKGKKVRTILTRRQRYLLIGEFLRNTYPSSTRTKRLAFELKLELKVIRVWFQNQRQKKKNDEKFYLLGILAEICETFENHEYNY